MISLLYLIFFSFLVLVVIVSVWLSLLYNVESRSKATELTYLYLLFYLFFCIGITFLYIEDIFLWWIFWLEESFIVKDPNDWVWATFSIFLILTIFFYTPYIIFINLIKVCSSLFKAEQMLLNCIVGFIIYFLFLSFFWLVWDFAFAGVVTLSSSAYFVSFEFQPELENFILFVLGTFFDFFLTISFIQMLFFFVFILREKRIYVKCKTFFHLFLRFLFLFILVVILYWFGGEGINQDFFLFCFILCALFSLRWLKLFFSYLYKLKLKFFLSKE